jgi:hypothetical protein
MSGPGALSTDPWDLRQYDILVIVDETQLCKKEIAAAEAAIEKGQWRGILWKRAWKVRLRAAEQEYQQRQEAQRRERQTATSGAGAGQQER